MLFRPYFFGHFTFDKRCVAIFILLYTYRRFNFSLRFKIGLISKYFPLFSNTFPIHKHVDMPNTNVWYFVIYFFFIWTCATFHQVTTYILLFLAIDELSNLPRDTIARLRYCIGIWCTNIFCTLAYVGIVIVHPIRYVYSTQSEYTWRMH